MLPGPVIAPAAGSARERLNEALAKQAATVDEAERAKVVGEAQELAVSDDAFTVPVYEIPALVGLAREVQGFSFTASANLFLYDTWLSGG